jgi:hypothetical protein
MKNLIYIALLLITVLTFGCNKDFLDRVPQDQISEPAFWKTPNDLQLYVNNLYARLGTYTFTQDEGSDNALSSSYKSSRMLGQVLSTTDAIGDEYGYIRQVNIMIANMDKVTDPEGNQYKGEAYYLRAFHYFNILKDVGPAQIVKAPLKSDEKKLYTILRSPRDSVADFILSDLDKAISLLQIKSDLGKTGDYQRISKDAALAFKSRVALYEGSWEKYHNGTPFGVSNPDYNKYFTQAAGAAKTLIDNFGYKLDDNYQSVFKHHELAGTPIASDEIIFGRQFDHVKYNVNWAASGEQMNTWPVGVGYTRSAIRSYLCTDGLPISVSPLYVGDTSLATITQNRDPRLAMTLYTPGELWRVSGTGDSTWFPERFLGPNGGSLITGYVGQKFYIPDAFETPGQNRLTWDHITIYFRYGEVLLNYAEAKAELGQFDQAAADISINRLRSRASVQMPPLMVGSIVTDPDWPEWGYSLSPLLQEIRRERRIELIGEEFRFDDLMRWAAAKLITGKNYKGGYFESLMEQTQHMQNIPRDADNYLEPFKDFLPEGYQFDPKRDYLLPFPLDEITLNPKLTQNPGW